jgi:hypothetical protein
VIGDFWKTVNALLVTESRPPPFSTRERFILSYAFYSIGQEAKSIMTTQVERQGRCLCRAVNITVNLEKMSVSACHCSTCRRWGGGPLMVVESATPLQFEGEEHVQVYDSSEWAERGFCSRCGTHLFYRLKQGGFYAVPVGLLDNQDNWTFSLQVFIEEKPAFYCFANDTQTLTGKELVAQFSAE